MWLLSKPTPLHAADLDLGGNRRQCWEKALVRCNAIEEHLFVEKLVVVVKEDWCVGHRGESQGRNTGLQACKTFRPVQLAATVSQPSSQCCDYSLWTSPSTCQAARQASPVLGYHTHSDDNSTRLQNQSTACTDTMVCTGQGNKSRLSWLGFEADACNVEVQCRCWQRRLVASDKQNNTARYTLHSPTPVTYR